MWFYETIHSQIRLGIKGKTIYKKKTGHQDCRIYQTKDFGKVLLLDGAIQTTEADEHIYHEMLTHPLLLTHPSPKSVLVIGGGDGGVIREVFKHAVEEVIMVEIDKDVIQLSKKYLPKISKKSFSNKRLGLIIDDGAKYIKETPKRFDLVIIDSPDPIGPAKALFSKDFYKDVFKILTPQGLMIRQTGSTFLQPEVLKNNYRKIKNIFPHVSVQLAAIPTYIGGFFSFVVGSKKINLSKLNKSKIMKKYSGLNLKTKYYNPDIHFSSLKLTNDLMRLIK
ncbi:MAG: polyamine aminopropyltransferase [Candidatus Omnitrophica bacterium]|nr:polyamine aminopropyltransferase [Candidatus Omnitrophota bacterium]